MITYSVIIKSRLQFRTIDTDKNGKEKEDENKPFEYSLVQQNVKHIFRTNCAVRETADEHEIYR